MTHEFHTAVAKAQEEYYRNNKREPLMSVCARIAWDAKLNAEQVFHAAYSEILEMNQ